MRLALLLAILFALAGAGVARADDVEITKRLWVDTFDVRGLDLSDEQILRVVRRLVPGARVEHYGWTRIAVLGRYVERVAVDRLFWRLAGSRRRVSIRPRFRRSFWMRRPLLLDEPRRVVRILRAEAGMLAGLLEPPHRRFVLRRVLEFEDSVFYALGGLADPRWCAASDDREALLVQHLELRLEAGLLLRRLTPGDAPDAEELRRRARRLLDAVNQIGRDGSHHWRPGMPYPRGVGGPFGLAGSRERLEEALALLRGAECRDGLENRLLAYVLIEDEWTAQRGQSYLPIAPTPEISPRLQEVIDFVERVGREIERLRESVQRKSR